MKKNGFTLAEVLISLAIVGIIAAITIPQIVAAVEKRKVGPTLGRVVEQIELGSQNLIQHFNEGRTDNNNYYTLLSDIPDLDVKMLASFFGASPVKGTFTENDVKDYIAYDPLSFLMPAAYAVYINGTDCSLKENINKVACKGYTDPNTPDQQGYLENKYNLFEEVGDGKTNDGKTNDGKTNNGSSLLPTCFSGQELYQSRSGKYGCFTPCGEGYEKEYDANGVPFCKKIETPIPSDTQTEDSIVTKDPESYDSFVQTYDYQGSGYDWTTGCPVDMNYVTLTVPTGYGYCGESWNSQVTVNTCVSDQDLKNLSQQPDYGGLCWAPSVITPSGCPEGQDIFLDSNDTAGCYTPCGEGYEEDYDENGIPSCKKIEPDSPSTPPTPPTPPSPPNCAEGEELVQDSATGEYSCKKPNIPPAPAPTSSNLYRLNKLATEIYFVDGIKAGASKPTDVIARILVDYNGTKAKPNTVGRDIFEFDLLNNGKLKAYDNFAKEIVKNGFKTE